MPLKDLMRYGYAQHIPRLIKATYLVKASAYRATPAACPHPDRHS
ncbi:hypothetical protein [Leptolyngbya sp. FACHB-321]|nr:hypothetical protein [Leptolyngbya sp. FACHB-321]